MGKAKSSSYARPLYQQPCSKAIIIRCAGQHRPARASAAQRTHPGACSSVLACSSVQAYSYFSVSTGFSAAARFAGTVPKITPTIMLVDSAITADHTEIGM